MNPVTQAMNRAYKIGEVGKHRWDVLRFCTGFGFDLGCGSFKVHRNAIGMDGVGNWGGIPSQANLGGDITKLDWFSDNCADFVFSSHALEDLNEPEKALKDWWRIVKPGGHLVLILPHPTLYKEAMAGDPNGVNAYHVKDIFPETILDWMRKLKGGWDCRVNLTREGGPFQDEYSFIQVFQKIKWDKIQSWKTKPEKSIAVVRYGGMGDQIMTSAIAPVLKEQGFHVTWVTNPQGKDILQHCPYIDDIWTDTAALPDPELFEYWTHIRTRMGFSAYLNMMNSVENVTLPQPWQGNYWLSKPLRDALFNLPYMDTTFLQAELETPEARGWERSGAKFYLSKEEESWARKERQSLNGQYVVTLALAGSNAQKRYPWWRQVIRGLLEQPDITVVSIGGPAEKVLYQREQETPDSLPVHPRHLQKAGEWTHRQANAFAMVSDLVVGPETGTLNAVGEMSLPKVLLLSHSTEEQLCKYWQEYTALKADTEFAPCAPCHRIHWDFAHCNRDEATGAALCAAGIPPTDVVNAILSWYKEGRRRTAA